jgi:hypothetical protein
MAFKFEELKIWEEAVSRNGFYLSNYNIPIEEQFGLTESAHSCGSIISLFIADG